MIILTHSVTAERDLSIHEQAVWMLLSRVELSSPTDSILTNSMVDSFVSDSMSVSDTQQQHITTTADQVMMVSKLSQTSKYWLEFNFNNLAWN